ncbi:SseB family protein [Streptomyces sp. NPDC059785]|uniref:SseB family protein n=1 Tax=unclassified Streptomyces TaxID=2593676 RepID=UPI0036570A95
METPSNDRITHVNGSVPATPAQEALDTLARDTEDTAALDTLAGSEVLVPVPDDAAEEDAVDPTAVALPVLDAPGGDQVVPVFTSELEMAGLLPSVSRYRLVPLGALASQWPAGELSLTIDASSPHGLTLTSEGVRTLLARPQG